MKNKVTMNVLLYISMLIASCNSGSTNPSNNNPSNPNKQSAKIVSVTITGNENNYTFSVGISSPDKGCNQYANWWEVISEDGSLIYRRILMHSHVDEQPFVRSGGKVNISKNQTVLVRVHMNNSSYSEFTFKGSVSDGFKSFKTENDFAKGLENVQPLPTGCAF